MHMRIYINTYLRSSPRATRPCIQSPPCPIKRSDGWQAVAARIAANTTCRNVNIAKKRIKTGKYYGKHTQQSNAQRKTPSE